jgi:hypothetical protein
MRSAASLLNDGSFAARTWTPAPKPAKPGCAEGVHSYSAVLTAGIIYETCPCGAKRSGPVSR